ncbi:MAG: sporulation transcriptional regulator SpoIIID [Clostridia bacterium]|nr:sporulation transcriptional regulator SpoIIID [Clostridia bacterium]
MKNISIEERAVKLAHYIIDSKDTVRGAAKRYGISKSTVHMELPKVEIYKIPSIILLSRGTAWSPQAKVKLAVRV